MLSNIFPIKPTELFSSPPPVVHAALFNTDCWSCRCTWESFKIFQTTFEIAFHLSIRMPIGKYIFMSIEYSILKEYSGASSAKSCYSKDRKSTIASSFIHFVVVSVRHIHIALHRSFNLSGFSSIIHYNRFKNKNTDWEKSQKSLWTSIELVVLAVSMYSSQFLKCSNQIGPHSLVESF